MEPNAPVISYEAVNRKIKSFLFFLPSILMLSFYCSAIYSKPVIVSGQVSTECCLHTVDTGLCYKTNAPDLGEGNTIEGYRVENTLFETRGNQSQNEVVKFLARRNIINLQTRFFGYVSVLKHNPINACVDSGIVFHQLLL